MFQCIVCTKQAAGDDGDEGEQHRENGENGESGNGTPRRKDPVRSLTAQVLSLSSPTNFAFAASFYPSIMVKTNKNQTPIGGPSSGGDHPWNLLSFYLHIYNERILCTHTLSYDTVFIYKIFVSHGYTSYLGRDIVLVYDDVLLLLMDGPFLLLDWSIIICIIYACGGVVVVLT